MSTAVSEASSAEKILERIESLNTNKVQVAVVDIDGILRGKVIHIDKFRSCIEGGFGFCNVELFPSENSQ